MASNKDLQGEILDLADAMNLDLETLGDLDKMNNGQLSATVEKLKKQQAEAEPPAPVAQQQPDEVEEAEEVVPHHEVAPGVSITSKRGILPPGTEVTHVDLSGGEKAFKRLIDRKKIVYVE